MKAGENIIESLVADAQKN